MIDFYCPLAGYSEVAMQKLGANVNHTNISAYCWTVLTKRNRNKFRKGNARYRREELDVNGMLVKLQLTISDNLTFVQSVKLNNADLQQAYIINDQLDLLMCPDSVIVIR